MPAVDEESTAELQQLQTQIAVYKAKLAKLKTAETTSTAAARLVSQIQALQGSDHFLERMVRVSESS